MHLLKLFIILLQIAFTIAIDVRKCNEGLLNDNKFTISEPQQSIPVITSDDYWHLKGDYKTVEGYFETPIYLTGFGIKVNTEVKSPCTFVESSIDLREFEISIDNKRVDFSNRKLINTTFIKVSFITTYGSTVQIRKTSTDPLLYCIQYELYGCTDTPTNCEAVLSYDYTEPVTADPTYTGVCSDNWCSGGLGVLMDSTYKNSLRWEETAQFIISFYQQVGIGDILVYLKSNASIIAPTSQFPTVIENERINFSLETILNDLEFEINVGTGNSFEIEEILIIYWEQNKPFTVPCGMKSAPVNSLSDNTAVFISIGVGLIMFIIGLALPITFWYTRRRTIGLSLRCKTRNIENATAKVERTEHVYTDIRSHESAADTKSAVPITIEGLARDTNLSPQRNPYISKQISFADSMEEQVRIRTLERQNREKDNAENSLEDNPIYDSRKLSNSPDELDRTKSEVFTSENPHYVTTEMMRLNSSGNVNKPKDQYQNVIPPVNEVVFNAYDKLDHSSK